MYIVIKSMKYRLFALGILLLASPGVHADISGSNESVVTATGVQVTDQLPAGVLYVSDDSAGDYTPATGLWSVGSLTANATKTLKITVTVK